MIRKALIALSGLAFVAAAQDAKAGMITGLFGTGQTATGALATPGTTDLHYTVASTLATEPTTAAYVVPPALLPSVYATSTTSQWISEPGFPTEVSTATYTYSTTFNDTDKAGGLVLSLTADDSVTAFLNGTQITTTTPISGYGQFYNFTFTSTTAFNTGSNTLTFVVTNNGGGPEALNVSVTSVPEPASLGMMALGLGGIAAAARVRRRKA